MNIRIDILINRQRAQNPITSIMQTVNTLVELCCRLRKETEGKTTEEAFNILQSLVGEHVRVRTEIVRDDTEDTADVNAAPGKFSYLNGVDVHRVLLTADRLKADFTRELVRSCNGVVLEYPGWNVLAVPSPMFKPDFRVADVASNMDSYRVYKINDGTTVTLYYYNDTWCISSTNGFDVSGYKWMGSSTYMEALTSAAKLYPGFCFGGLNESYAYTVGFRHNDFHPLLSDPASMWLIQTCDVSALNSENPKLVMVNVDIGLPQQTAVKATGVGFFKHLQETNANALGRYLSSVRGSNANPDIHYGYVLRSDSLTGALSANSNIILESDLLKKIRNLMYNLPKNKFAGATPITSANRLEYTILRAYLSCNDRFTFIGLFPQFQKQYDSYNNSFNKLSSRILGALRNRNVRENIANPRDKDVSVRRIDTLAFALVKHIEDCGKINGFDSQATNIVLDFIMNKKYLDLYYACWFSESKQ